MNERIKQIRKRVGLTQAEFADKLGIKPNTVTCYETGIRIPSDAIIKSISKNFNVSDTWLRTGEGEMFIQLNEDQELLEVLADLQVDEENPVRDLLIAYWRLNDDQKAAIKQMIKNLIDLQKGKAGQ